MSGCSVKIFTIAKRTVSIMFTFMYNVRGGCTYYAMNIVSLIAFLCCLQYVSHPRFGTALALMTGGTPQLAAVWKLPVRLVIDSHIPSLQCCISFATSMAVGQICLAVRSFHPASVSASVFTTLQFCSDLHIISSEF